MRRQPYRGRRQGAAATTSHNRRKEPEHVEQAALFHLIRLHEARFPELLECYAVPNGRGRSKAEAGKLWAEGVRPGRLDVNLDVSRVYQGEAYHGLRIEMKAANGRLTREQQGVIARATRHGYLCVAFWTWRPAWNLIVDYLGLSDRYQQQLLPTDRQ